ncbi:hypothetical protein FHR75_001837 [Kineococcus radiotolerans]|uniref:Uncharacterized protein n=1 Tax=Kineococcus radiotolerans TaxID=131568 RepID=A0A7W4TLD6_KINRA|nr:hypothetical protein [Kineococcus radiotolerans]MBB2901049.1 hypothetical protein [Kineococcus radiotolerans]
MDQQPDDEPHRPPTEPAGTGPAGAGVGERVGQRADQRVGAAPEPGGWASWLLVAVAAAPVLVLGEVARRHLGGGLDARYFGATAGSGEDAVGLGLGWSTRFSLLWTAVPVPEVLLAALAGLLVLCALVVAGRPAWLVPGRWGRRAAAGVAALAAAESLIALLTLAGRADDSEREGFGGLSITYYVPPTGRFPEIAPVLALLAVTTVLPALAALVLWRDGDGAPAGRGDDDDDVDEVDEVDAAPDADGDDTGDLGATPAVTTPTAAAPGTPAAPPAVAGRGPGPAPGIPTVPAHELDAYRRPRVP